MYISPAALIAAAIRAVACSTDCAPAAHVHAQSSAFAQGNWHGTTASSSAESWPQGEFGIAGMR